jgi:hypothetical protein
MSGAPQLPEGEFQQIEEFISRTARGRAFLREHTLRAQTGVAEEVRNLVAELRDMWRQQTEASHLVNRVAVLRHELQDMSASISHARREIAAIKPAETGDGDRFMAATNELDAIIVSTERASTEILGAAERVLDMVGRLRGGADVAELCTEIEGEVMTVFTACSFQDLTGQRTTKVINVLRYIEQRIAAMIEIWGGVQDVSAAELPPQPVDARPDAHLLHGPQLHGISQDQIDRLMSGAAPDPAAPAFEPPKPADKPAAPVAAKNSPTVDEEPVIVPLDQSAIDALFG